jgi:hypothetical protein
VVAVVPRFEEVGVAIFATKHVDMNFVTECGNTDALGLDGNIASVTGDTVAGHTESLSTVVTGATGSALLHHLHGDMVAVILFFEDTRVADITLEGMQTVAKHDRANTLGLDGELVDHTCDTSHTSHTNSMQLGDRKTNQQ